MKKRKLIFAATASLMLCACGSKTTTPTTTQVETTTAAPVTTEAVTESASETAAEETNEFGLTESEAAEIDQAFDDMTYDSVESLNEELGYASLTLPEYWGEPAMVALVDGQSCIAYIPDSLEPVIQVNTSPTKIKEVNTTEKSTEEERTIDGVTVRVISSPEEKLYSAFWSDDSLNYNIDATAIEEDQFEQALNDCIGITKSLPGGKPA